MAEDGGLLKGWLCLATQAKHDVMAVVLYCTTGRFGLELNAMPFRDQRDAKRPLGFENRKASGSIANRNGIPTIIRPLRHTVHHQGPAPLCHRFGLAAGWKDVDQIAR